MIVWLAVALWAVIVVWSLALMRAASSSGIDPRRAPEPPDQRLRTAPVLGKHRERTLVIVEALILASSITAMVLLSTEDQWQPFDLVGLIAVLVVGSDFLTLRAKRFRISGSFLGLVLAMAVLGPAPAGAMGIACASVDAIRGRTRGSYLLSNIATYAFFPVVGALVLEELTDLGMADDGGVAVAVFAVFVLTNLLNFAMIAGHTVYLRGGSLVEMFKTVYMPVFPWELATASLTAMAVYGFERYGAGVIGLFALALGVCQLLLRSLLKGHEDGEEVLRRMDQLDVRHEGMVGLLLETLALRDPPAARHAAAVAHYSRQLARAAGLSEHEQAVAHTAGLLHDIGKEALPDHILLGRSELHAAERRLVERHPADGARLLLRVEGLGEVAHAVLAHHERIDGHGYPDGLAGEDIPITARILAIATLSISPPRRLRFSMASPCTDCRRSWLAARRKWLFARLA